MTRLARIAGSGDTKFVPSGFQTLGDTSHRRAQRLFTIAHDSPEFQLDLPPGGVLPFEPACFVAVIRRFSGDFNDPALLVERADGANLTIAMEAYRYSAVMVFVAVAADLGPIRGARFQVDCRRAGFKLIGAGWMSAKSAGDVLEAANRQRFAALGPRIGRALYRIVPFGKSTKLRWARQLFPYSWLRIIDPAADLFRTRPAGIWQAEAGGAMPPAGAVYLEAWNQSVGVVDRKQRGELAVRPVRTERCDVKLIAYYLPQYHPIPENDRWWGRGFTEWANVGKAVPVFVGHYQPRLPGELGYYDLRVVDVMRRQVELAKLYGISAFSFYFYWFGGKRLLETPLLNFLANQDIDLPFCLCWANENWTRRWDGAEREMLISQAHSPEDDVAFIRYLRKYFDDPRYLKIDGRPVLTVYRPTTLPEPKQTVARWRAEAKAMGFPDLYLITTNAFGFTDHASVGFDAISEFPPHGVAVPNTREELNFLSDEFTGLVHHYSDVVRMPGSLVGEGKVWPGVMLGWDNVARMQRLGRVFHGATPLLFREWLRKAIVRARRNPPGERFVLVNAWNEWAEGAYLEPDRRFGYAWLAACASALADLGTPDEAAAALFAGTRARFKAGNKRAVLLHLFHDEMAGELARAIDAFGGLDVYITVPRDVSAATASRLTGLFPAAYIQEMENRGRDMLPFLTMVEAVRETDYEFVLKLHTRQAGLSGVDREVAELLSGGARDALRAASGKPKAGIVGKTARATPGNEHIWRYALARARTLAVRLGVHDLAADEPLIPSGMFWFRPAALAPLRGIAPAADFEPELGQGGGTLAHAISCLPPIAARSAGFEVLELDARRVEAQLA